MYVSEVNIEQNTIDCLYIIIYFYQRMSNLFLELQPKDLKFWPMKSYTSLKEKVLELILRDSGKKEMK